MSGAIETADEPPPRHYAVRITEGARREIEAVAARFVETLGEDIALLWIDQLEAKITALAGNPRRHPSIAEQARSRPNDRVHVYRIGNHGRLDLARRIEVHGASRKISRAALIGAIPSFTVSGDSLRR